MVCHRRYAMRLLLVTVGSRGDAEPFQALTDALTAAGHVVDLYMQPEHNFAPAKPELVTLHPFPFSTTDFYTYAAKPRYGQDHENPRVKFVGVVAEVVSQLIAGRMVGVLPCMKDVLKVAEGCDVLVCSSLPRHMCFCIGKMLRKPVGLIHLQPLVPTKAFPHYSAENAVDCILKGGSSDENEQTYWTFEQYNFDFLKEDLQKVVDETLGTDAMISFEDFRSMFGGASDLAHGFNCFSSDLCPAPAEGHIHDIGALADAYIPASFSEPSDLLQFLQELGDGNPPVAIGFGSMPFGQAEAVIQGLESLRCPAVLVGKALANFQATEWTKKNILQVDSVAYPWLLPRCRCMLSHGGAGVLHSTLRAGIPAIIAPLIGDQFVFAKLIDARELGVNAGPMNALTADGLVASLKALEGPRGERCANNARDFAAKVKDKNSPAKLVELLEKMKPS